MTVFPDIPLGHTLELLLSGTWTDITPWLDNDQVSMMRGHPDESTTVTASTMAAVLQNSDGRFTSRNPSGPWYGSLGRNVQGRVSVPAQSNYLRLEADAQDRAYVNDDSAIDVTGSIEVRIALRLTDWQGGVLACKWDGGACWYWLLNPAGTLTFGWYDGSAAHSVTSSQPLPYNVGDQALRVTMSAATGTVTFYTSAAIGGTWAQLGAAASATGGAATSIAVSHVSALVAGYSGNFSPSQILGRVYELQLWNGISGSGGTLAADAVFSAQAAGTATWTDSAGNTWNLAGGAEISSRDYRCHVEIPEWPQQQSPGGQTVQVAIAGGGLLRRKGQLNTPVRSAMYRAYETLSDLVAYWPMEDLAGSGSFASGLGGPAMQWSGTPALASSSPFASSAALPSVNGAVFTATVPAYPGGTANVLRIAFSEAAGSIPNGAVIARLQTAGTVAWADLVYYAGGGLGITGYNAAGAQVLASGTVGFAVDGGDWLVEIDLWQSGSAVAWSVNTMAPGAASQSGSGGTLASALIGQTLAVTVNPAGAAGLGAVTIGHVAVQSAYTGTQLQDFGAPLNAWQGETAGARFARLCAEEGLQCRIQGNLPATAVMGAQTQQTITQLLQECADADRGTWKELRQQLGWGYTARNALYNQTAQVTVDYDEDDLSVWASPPTEDDRVILNDATITQTNGGTSARQFAAPGQPITGGPPPSLSTQDPPAGVGVYDSPSTPQVNLLNAADLMNTCGWMVHMGTVSQPRFPGINMDLANRALAGQFWAIADMDLGDRLVVNNPPAWLPPGPASQLCQQYSETLGTFEWMVTVCGVPEVPYEVAADGAGFRIDTDGSTLAAAASPTATTISVATDPGFPLWTTSSGDFPFDVNVSGERMTVTNITGASSPQSFTVTRSVNGVVKAQAVTTAGVATAVALFNTPVAAL